jgi:hypothetical protein
MYILKAHTPGMLRLHLLPSFLFISGDWLIHTATLHRIVSALQCISLADRTSFFDCYHDGHGAGL